MSERVTRWTAVAVGMVAAALTLANVVLLVLGRNEFNNSEGDLIFGAAGALGCVLTVGERRVGDALRRAIVSRAT